MPIRIDPLTGYETWEDDEDLAPERAAATPGADATKAGWLDPNDPNYRGPAWHMNEYGDVVQSQDSGDLLEQHLFEERRDNPVPTGNVGATTDNALAEAERLQNEVDPGPVTPVAAFQATLPPGSAPRRTVAPRAPAGGAITGSVDPTGVRRALGRVTVAPPVPPTGAEQIDRERIDTLLGGLNTYGNDIYALGKDNTGLSAAEAQLKQATELANIQAGIETDKSQRAALGQARSARNRGDRAFLEQQAIGEAGFIGQEAARTKALTDAQARGDLADLRAAEENYDNEFRLKALSKAAELNLNTAALELDISKANLDSVTNLLNQQFGQLGIDKQLNAQQAQQMLNFTRDMAAIQFEYDQLSVTDQQEAARLLMNKYQVDEGTRVALEKIKNDNDFDWNALTSQLIGGAAAGATAAIAKKA